MKKMVLNTILLSCIVGCFCFVGNAQTKRETSINSGVSEVNNKRMENYQRLKNQGFTDIEIYQDLGNANFLNDNYLAAMFWYNKLKQISKNGKLTATYQKRYNYALAISIGDVSSIEESRKDWVAEIKSDYKVNDVKDKKYRALDFNNKEGNFVVYDAAPKQLEALLSDEKGEDSYKSPIAMSPDGRSAYFSKAIYMKPETGVFSKKEKFHKIFKVEKVNGRWSEVSEVVVAPKYASVMHPSISSDGQRLFFASDMPGTFGQFDIYVSQIKHDGSLGMAKNLGEKVNTKKNDMYPNVVGNNNLFFASNGRKGNGGLDVYLSQVGQRTVSVAANLGKDVNSKGDDYAVTFADGNRGYVSTNRGDNQVHQVAFSFTTKNSDDIIDSKLFEAFGPESSERYTNTLFEDE